MKHFIIALLCVAMVAGGEIFVDKQEASQYLVRKRRDNNGFLEELQQGNQERECIEEVCNYEEAREVFEDDAATATFWNQLTAQCATYEPCNSTGTFECQDVYNGYVCHCNSGYSGTNCEIEPVDDVDVCDHYENLCVNGGECVDGLGNTYYCLCSNGWTGSDCAQDINECNDDPCNNGVCLNHFGSFECLCNAGYEGPLCNDEINECDFGYCPTGSECQDGLNSFTCVCPEEGCSAQETVQVEQEEQE